jgi:predicted enzyme related to lactoylglutathione lyase
MTNIENAITWFELPVRDMDRAVRFWEAVMETKLKREVFGGHDHAIFEAPDPGVAGALVKSEQLEPSGAGARIYLDTRGKLDACVERVASAGGAVLLPKTDIGEPGWIAIVKDTEGNAVGLHQSRKRA